jgi:hypothetical protein
LNAGYSPAIAAGESADEESADGTARSLSAIKAEGSVAETTDGAGSEPDVEPLGSDINVHKTLFLIYFSLHFFVSHFLLEAKYI